MHVIQHNKAIACIWYKNARTYFKWHWHNKNMNIHKRLTYGHLKHVENGHNTFSLQQS